MRYFRPSSFGAYMPATYYAKGDPVWVREENSWLKAFVLGFSRSWVNVEFAGGRDRRGNYAKAYQPPFVWPVICDYPTPVRHIFTGIPKDLIDMASSSPGKRSGRYSRRLWP